MERSMTVADLDWNAAGLGGAIAALPMYDLPELQGATDALWDALRGRLQAHGIDNVPAVLTRGRDHDWIWNAPNLLLAQARSYSFVTRLSADVRLVATPAYSAEGCSGPFHRAVILVRKGFPAEGLADLRGTRLAINAPDSNTGMNLLRAELSLVVRDSRIFAETVATGSHADSAAAVAEGQADAASIDCITWALLQRVRPALTEALSVLAWTSRSPGRPLITSRTTSLATVDALRLALDGVAADPALEPVRRDLCLEGFHPLSEPYYRALLRFEQMASSLGNGQLS
jgi:ABC-type phosphate/phosphonate transport system substrate-binding protein